MAHALSSNHMKQSYHTHTHTPLFTLTTLEYVWNCIY